MVIGVKVQRPIDILQRDEINDIHQTTLKILENIGVVFQDDGILNLLDENGAIVDRKSQIIKFPTNLVKEALKSAPAEYRLYNRAGDDYASIGGGWLASRLSMSGIYLVDSRTRTRRTSTKKDVEEAVKLAERLENIHLAGPGCMPQDVGHEVMDIYMWLPQLKYSSKPLGSTFALSIESTSAILKMAEAVYGGEEELRKKPRIRYYAFEPRSPLVYEALSLRIMEEFAVRGYPVMIAPMPMAGLTAPVTIAGALALHNAENLAGVVVTQLLRKGLPISIAGGPSISDPRTGLFLWAAPERVIMNCAYGQIARYYDLPSFAYTWHTESNITDPQAAFEKAFISFPAMISGYNEAIGVGSLGSEAFSFQQAVLDDELLDEIFRIAEGFSVTDETLAFDVTKRIGPGNNFVKDKHTLEHLRTELWVPSSVSVFNRKRWEVWEAEGKKITLEAADEKARKLLSEFNTEPLPKDVEKEIDNIVHEVEERLLR